MEKRCSVCGVLYESGDRVREGVAGGVLRADLCPLCWQVVGKAWSRGATKLREADAAEYEANLAAAERRRALRASGGRDGFVSVNRREFERNLADAEARRARRDARARERGF